MASYIIAGKADDVSFARAEFAAKQIEASCPNIFFRYEMKHPDMWQDFIVSVFRKYDFDGYPEDFPGPLVWTHEGDLIGGCAEFIQQVCLEKFGIPSPPAVTDAMFKDIAKDNMKQVKLQQHREINGPPFGERCDATHKQALSSWLLTPPIWTEERRVVIQGSSMEVWVSSTLGSEREQLRQSFGNGESVVVDAGLAVTNVGPEQSHSVLLHPKPLVPKHLVLAPRRCIKKTEGGYQDEGHFGIVFTPSTLEVPPSSFRGNPDEDLGEADFISAMEVLSATGGVACWMGIRGATEYRDPLDTHLQVLPFPVHHQGEDSPMRYPLELACERALKNGDKSLSIFPFQNSFAMVSDPAERKSPADLAKDALRAFEQVRGRSGQNDSFAVAFTTTWLCLMPLEPPEAGSARHEAWLQLPPPPPCALCGIVVSAMVGQTYPETAQLPQSDSSRMVSTRALEEGIPEGSPEFEAANREVRINTRITGLPLEIMAVWAKK